MFEYDTRYMSRALELAARGRGYTTPNPMVGAVIVHEGSIIGEGYHRLCGQAHAEVNAVNSVTDRSLLADSTMYVTLEPCSHYGKTPPCAKLIIDNRIPRVVVGAVDPFVKVAGRGINMLREAGVQVIDGIMADESRRLNARFFTAHTQRRPFVTLKWARSADGYMDHRRNPCEPAARFSNIETTTWTHRLRAMHDAILTTSSTVNADNPSLTVRAWHGRDPRPILVDRHNSVHTGSKLLDRDPIIYNTDLDINALLTDLYHTHGITSVLVETGPTMLRSFIESGLWDVARVETTSEPLGDNGIAPAPVIAGTPACTRQVAGNRIDCFTNNQLVEPTIIF